MTTSTLTLSAFLLARIEEDERLAQDFHETAPFECDMVFHARVDPGFGWTCTCNHPARILAECKAKRVILERFETSDDIVIYPIIQALASVYADHPDFNPDWS